MIWVSVGCVSRVRCTDARTLYRTPVAQRTARTDTDCMPVLYTLLFLKHRAVLKELFMIDYSLSSFFRVLELLETSRSRPPGPEWLWQRPTTGSSNMAAETGSTYISGTMIDSVEISRANLGFSTMRVKESARKWFRQLWSTTGSNDMAAKTKL